MSYFKDAETIYNEMISTIGDVDTSEHSLIYNADKPVSYSLSYNTMIMDEIVKMMFVQTALEAGYGEMVVKKCTDLGIDRKQAEYSTGTIKIIGRENSVLPVNTMVSTKEGLVYYTKSELTIDSRGVGYVDIKAKESGSKYNVEANTIIVFPTKYSGIISVTNENVLANGYNEESLEDLIKRYNYKLRNNITSGNINHYKQWALEVDGVGDCKVFEEKDENMETKNGHVCIVVVNSNGEGANIELVTNIYKHIEENRPVGAKVHVKSATEKAINVSAKLTIDTNVIDLIAATNNIKTILSNKLKEMTFKNSVISLSKIGALILSVNGIEDYSNLTINNSIENINIGDIEIPILGIATFTIV